ncbi:TonB-dependent receptor [Granulicella paludicola]|uniref:TonB-dependent receptor n=1 Tax=Granulicella paludicola TaxID=474951 RepID=UPI0021DF679B|nr:TonB-dependent receptor [Granulicella paludicola]
MTAKFAKSAGHAHTSSSRSVRRTWGSPCLFVLAGLLSVFCFTRSSFAQGTEGNITGTVTAADGGLVPKATVTVTNEGTHFSRTVVSDASGNYMVTALNPGNYTVKIDADGFSELQNKAIALSAQQTVRIDAHLKISGVSSTVTVMADTSVLNLEMPSISSTVTAEQLNDTSSNLLGTSDSTGDSGLLFYTTLLPGGSQAGTLFDWSMYGSRGNEAYYNVDGISSNSALYGNMVGPSLPPFGMVQEVQYTAVNNKAELGQLFNISMITKSGTNSYHGDVFENYGADVLQAPGYFAKGKVGSYNQNDFGADVGGPILKDKLFFYASSELLREDTPITLTPSLPTAAFESGDFSALSTPITNPYAGGAPFAYGGKYNQIDPSLISPAAKYWQSLFYPSSIVGQSTLGPYAQNVYTNRFYGRVDYSLSKNNTLFARVGYIRSSPESLDSGLPPSITGYRVQKRHTWQGVMEDTWILSPHIVNVAKFGLTHTENHYGGAIEGQPLVNALGITGFPVVANSFTGIPSLGISGYTSPYQLPESQPTEETFQYIDQITYERGKHSFKAGVEYRPMEADSYFNPTFGSFSFTNQYTGNAYADFLLGIPDSTSYTYARSPEYARLWYVNTFLQDDWKVLKNLTLNLGVRYEYDSPAVDKKNIVASFDPYRGAIVVPNLQIAAANINSVFPSQIPIETAQSVGLPGRSLRNGYKLAVDPRFGFAYRPFNNDRTVIRGGYGIFNDEVSAALFGYNYAGPFGVNVAYSNSFVNNQPTVTFQSPFNTSAQGSLLGNISDSATDPNFRNPYVQQFNLTVEENVGFETDLRLSYIGTRGVKLPYANNIDQSPLGTVFNQPTSNYPDFYSVYFFRNGGYENYNAFSGELSRTFRHGLSYDVSLTWAKNLTDDDDTVANGIDGGVTAEQSFNLSREKGNARYTPRLDFTSNVVYELPIGKGGYFLNNDGYASRFLGGWKLSGAFLSVTGDYLTPTFDGLSTSNTSPVYGTNTPNRVLKSLAPIGKKSISNWFNPAAFAIPAQGTFGSGSFGTIEGPSSNTLNLALFKSFPVYRESHVELRGSFTNVLNHPNFGDPLVDLSVSPTNTFPGQGVGQINGTTGRSFAGPRSGLLSARFIF